MNHIFSLDQRRHPCWMNFTGEKYFGNFAFDAFCARSNMKIIWLSKDLRFKFGNAIFVFGYATIGNNKFHPPTPCLGIRDLLHRKGFDILLLDEYRTSSWLPLCKSEVKPLKSRRTPRPWQSNDPPHLVHGLLKCGSEECRAILGKERLWNRDLLATLNFLAILNGVRSGQGRLPCSRELVKVCSLPLIAIIL